MKSEDLRTLDGEELTSRLKSSRRELYELRFKLAVGQLDNHRQIRQVRKDIARILTVVHARRLGEEVMEAPAEIQSPVAVATAEDDEPETAAAEVADDAAEVADDDVGTDEKETPENVETAADESASAPASRKSSRSRGRKEGAE